MKDIVERLGLIVEDYTAQCSCNFGGCCACKLKTIVSEAIHEIEELRNPNEATKNE